ncbi:CpaF family protein [Brevibacterium sp. HMSC24B04]|uniref:CpaF family protein n=1 Tax=Brevibacterium sp. HMSC24B04 TaxID=1581060 RepID=UPI0008A4A8A2|nr:ATPase, T2SS/T4P/T4SS family [Brevibacterium sp. HMSC24B04]OFT92298.1 pilus assembly protein CpaF [Brevibacterium sp. HMSC24B04]HJH12789.1 Flp pilus assembly complex ATPase component TadA [Brevibacterium ravenspurgense]
MDATDIIAEQVRDAVRLRGLDPRMEPEPTRALIRDVIAAYDEHTLSGSLPLLDDPEQAFQRIVDDLTGFGPLQRFLDDPEVEEIWINSPDKVFISRDGVSELTTLVLSDTDVYELIEKMLRTSGRRVDLSQPFVDASLPDGSRLHVVLPDITRRHPSVNIRKFIKKTRSLDDLVRTGSLTSSAARFLDAAVKAGANIVVSGATQAGKTTMLNALAGSIPARERVISCEEVFELAIPTRDWVPMQCRQASLEGTGEVTLRDLVKEALRMRPTRIVVGEVRQAESFDLLIALNSGLPGMGTIHANSARTAVTKLCTLPLLAGPNIGSEFVTPTVAAALDLVVHLALNADGSRRVVEIAAVPGGMENGVVELESVFHTVNGTLVRGTGFTHLGERFSRMGLNIHQILENA